MDLQAKATQLVARIQEDPSLLARFQKEPIPVIEALIGIDLPDDQIRKLAELIQARIGLDKAGSLLKVIGGLFR